jgi:hypothetical protein
MMETEDDHGEHIPNPEGVGKRDFYHWLLLAAPEEH